MFEDNLKKLYLYLKSCNLDKEASDVLNLIKTSEEQRKSEIHDGYGFETDRGYYDRIADEEREKAGDFIWNKSKEEQDLYTSIQNIEDTSYSSSLDKKRTPDESGVRRAPNEIILPKFSFIPAPNVCAARKAIAESESYWGSGSLTEGSEDVYGRLDRYWQFIHENTTAKGGKRKVQYDEYGNLKNKGYWYGDSKERGVYNDPKWTPSGTKWSAAFVSFIMSQCDGQGAEWYVSESHSSYISQGKRVKIDIERDPSKYIDTENALQYVTFSKSDMNKYGIKIDLGDVVGRPDHTDIYIGRDMVVGGNTVANVGVYTPRDTSGPKRLNLSNVEYIIKRIKVVNHGSENFGLAQQLVSL